MESSEMGLHKSGSHGQLQRGPYTLDGAKRTKLKPNSVKDDCLNIKLTEEK